MIAAKNEPQAEPEDDSEGERLFGGDPEAPVEGKAFPALRKMRITQVNVC